MIPAGCGLFPGRVKLKASKEQGEGQKGGKGEKEEAKTRRKS